MTYYVYLILATNTGVNKSYVGYTNNLKTRIEKHNSNKGAKTTKGYNWELIYSKKFKSKNMAMSYEYKLKKDYKLRKKIKETALENE
jgi:putative endonuclease